MAEVLQLMTKSISEFVQVWMELGYLTTVDIVFKMKSFVALTLDKDTWII